MSRNFANLWTAIWRETDWRALSSAAQRTYTLLMSQPDITACGVLPLTVGRWASMAKDTTAATIRADLQELAASRYIVVDDEHEELLVRTFVKWDKGYGNPKRRPVILKDAHAVASPLLRAALAAEFVRLGLPTDSLMPIGNPADRPSDSHPGSPSAPVQPSTTRETPNWDQPTSVIGYAQVNSLSDRPSDRHVDRTSPSEGLVVTKAPYLLPGTSNQKPQTPAAPVELPPADAGATPTQRSKAITDAYAAVEPMSKWPAVNAIVLKAIKADRWTDEQIHDALQRLAADRRSVTVDSLRIELTGPPASRAQGYVEVNGLRLKPETAARIADDARFAAMDAARDRRAIEGRIA